MKTEEQKYLEYDRDQLEYSRRYDAGHLQALHEQLQETFQAAVRHHSRVSSTARRGSNCGFTLGEDDTAVERAARIRDHLGLILRGFWG